MDIEKEKKEVVISIGDIHGDFKVILEVLFNEMKNRGFADRIDFVAKKKENNDKEFNGGDKSRKVITKTTKINTNKKTKKRMKLTKNKIYDTYDDFQTVFNKNNKIILASIQDSIFKNEGRKLNYYQEYVDYFMKYIIINLNKPVDLNNVFDRNKIINNIIDEYDFELICFKNLIQLTLKDFFIGNFNNDNVNRIFVILGDAFDAYNENTREAKMININSNFSVKLSDDNYRLFKDMYELLTFSMVKFLKDSTDEYENNIIKKENIILILGNHEISHQIVSKREKTQGQANNPLAYGPFKNQKHFICDYMVQGKFKYKYDYNGIHYIHFNTLNEYIKYQKFAQLVHSITYTQKYDCETFIELMQDACKIQFDILKNIIKHNKLEITQNTENLHHANESLNNNKQDMKIIFNKILSIDTVITDKFYDIYSELSDYSKKIQNIRDNTIGVFKDECNKILKSINNCMDSIIFLNKLQLCQDISENYIIDGLHTIGAIYSNKISYQYFNRHNTIHCHTDSGIKENTISLDIRMSRFKQRSKTDYYCYLKHRNIDNINCVVYYTNKKIIHTNGFIDEVNDNYKNYDNDNNILNYRFFGYFGKPEVNGLPMFKPVENENDSITVKLTDVDIGGYPILAFINAYKVILSNPPIQSKINLFKTLFNNSFDIDRFVKDHFTPTAIFINTNRNVEILEDHTKLREEETNDILVNLINSTITQSFTSFFNPVLYDYIDEKYQNIFKYANDVFNSINDNDKLVYLFKHYSSYNIKETDFVMLIWYYVKLLRNKEEKIDRIIDKLIEKDNVVYEKFNELF